MKLNFFPNTIRKLLVGLLILPSFYLLFVGLNHWLRPWIHAGEEVIKGQVGIDICSQCRMKLSHPKHIVSIVLQQENRPTQNLHFDDVGCFKHYMERNPQAKYFGMVTDYFTGEWLNLTQAEIISDLQYSTPMNSHTIARKKP